jgi:hypothetical protein
MATRDHRLAEFNQGPPPLGQQLQLLCEDHNGTYLLPFAVSGVMARGMPLRRPSRWKQK